MYFWELYEMFAVEDWKLTGIYWEGILAQVSLRNMALCSARRWMCISHSFLVGAPFAGLGGSPWSSPLVAGADADVARCH